MMMLSRCIVTQRTRSMMSVKEDRDRCIRTGPMGKKIEDQLEARIHTKFHQSLGLPGLQTEMTDRAKGKRKSKDVVDPLRR